MQTVGVTLVDELVEGMLSVGPRLTPHDWSGVVLHTATVFGNVLPVRFHVALTTRDSSVGHSKSHICKALLNQESFHSILL